MFSGGWLSSLEDARTTLAPEELKEESIIAIEFISNYYRYNQKQKRPKWLKINQFTGFGLQANAVAKPTTASL